jgi:FixJ family two-component response regulator
MKCGTPTVYVVDDDPAMRDSLEFMFTGTGLPVVTYASAEAFLADQRPCRCGCLILDLRMPGMSGHELSRRLRALEPQLPVILLTGHGDISTAVSEMKQGAFDFFAKPVNRDVLLKRVREAVETCQARSQEGEEAADIRRKLADLSPRELEVIDLVAGGLANKKIALRLGLSERTVANHRAHVLYKLEAANTADVVRKLALVGQIGPRHGGVTPQPR